MTTKNNNRMLWIRTEDKITKEGISYSFEYEIASELRITGILDYNNYIKCGLYSIEKDENGLYHYLLKINHPAVQEYNNHADKKGYYFKDGELGEILSLFSLFFRARFYLIASFSGELSLNSIKTKFENKFLYKKTNSLINPYVLDENNKNLNFTKIPDFLDQIKKLDIEYHQDFMLSCHLYHLGLKEIGIDQEMVFIRLVSSIESIAKKIKLNKKDDILCDKNINKMINDSILKSSEKDELINLFDTRKSKKKFIRFLEQNNSNYFKGGNYKAKHCKIKKTDLSKVLSSVYDARSNYLHNGEPMYLSYIIIGEKESKWDTDPSMGMIIDNREISPKNKMPYNYFFEGLVRNCLINFLRKNQI